MDLRKVPNIGAEVPLSYLQKFDVGMFLEGWSVNEVFMLMHEGFPGGETVHVLLESGMYLMFTYGPADVCPDPKVRYLGRGKIKFEIGT